MLYLARANLEIFNTVRVQALALQHTLQAEKSAAWPWRTGPKAAAPNNFAKRRQSALCLMSYDLRYVVPPPPPTLGGELGTKDSLSSLP